MSTKPYIADVLLRNLCSSSRGRPLIARRLPPVAFARHQWQRQASSTGAASNPTTFEAPPTVADDHLDATIKDRQSKWTPQWGAGFSVNPQIKDRAPSIDRLSERLHESVESTTGNPETVIQEVPSSLRSNKFEMIAKAGMVPASYYSNPHRFREYLHRHVPLGQGRHQDVATLLEHMHACVRDGQRTVYNIIDMLLIEYSVPPNREIYRAMVLACTISVGSGGALLRSLVEEMQNEGVELDEAMCHDIIAALAVHPDQFLLDAILIFMENDGIKLRPEGHNMITASLLRDKQFELAMDRIDFMSREGIPVMYWLHDMLFYFLLEITDRDVGDALDVIKIRHEDNQPPVSPSMWLQLLDTGSKINHYESVEYVWTRQVQPEYINPPTGICLNVLATAARAGDANLATDVFRLLTSRKYPFEAIHYEMMAEAMLQAKDLRTAFNIYSIMESSGFPMNEHNTRALFVFLRRNPTEPAQALKILHQLKSEGASIPLAVTNTLVEFYCNEARAELFTALDIAKNHLPKLHPSGPNTATYNALLRGCNHAKGPIEGVELPRNIALRLAAQMKEEGISPDDITYDRLILSCIDPSMARMQKDDPVDQAALNEDAWRYYTEMKLRGWLPRRGTFRKLFACLIQTRDVRVKELLADYLPLRMVKSEAAQFQYTKMSIREQFGEATVRGWVAENPEIGDVLKIEDPA